MKHKNLFKFTIDSVDSNALNQDWSEKICMNQDLTNVKVYKQGYLFILEDPKSTFGRMQTFFGVKETVWERSYFILTSIGLLHFPINPLDPRSLNACKFQKSDVLPATLNNKLYVLGDIKFSEVQRRYTFKIKFEDNVLLFLGASTGKEYEEWIEALTIFESGR